MKKLFYLFLFLFVGTIFVLSCTKTTNNVNQIRPFKSSVPSVQRITLDDGNGTSITMLEFVDNDAYDSVLTSLEQKQESYEDAFVEQYSNLNDSLLNEKEEEIGYNDQQAFIDFENSLDFTNSMRQVYVVAEEEWLNNEYLDPATDPSNDYVFSNAEMAMLNEGGEVKIGVSLLKLTKDGFVEFTDGDINKLIRFDNGDMTVLNEPNVITSLTENSRSSDCKWWEGENNYNDYSYNKRVILHEHFHAYPWKGTSSARISSYKKKGKKWKKYRMYLEVQNSSSFYDRNCSSVSYQEASKWKKKRKKTIRIHCTSWGAFPGYRAKNGLSVIGQFKYAGHYSFDVLSW